MANSHGKSWIQSRSGRRVDLLTPDPSAIDIRDIAYALAGINRYTAHAKPRINVAEHSVRVSWRAAEHCEEAQRGLIEFDRPLDHQAMTRVARWGLLHDATEAYLGDVSRPLKYLPGMDGYRKLEAEWTKAVCARFGLEGEQPAEVTKADDEMLGTEAHVAMQPIHPDWGKTIPGGLPDPIPHFVWDMGWDPVESEDRFLWRFAQIFPEFAHEVKP